MNQLNLVLKPKSPTVKALFIVLGLTLLSMAFLDLHLDLWTGLMILGGYLINMGLFPWKIVRARLSKGGQAWRAWIIGLLLLGLSSAFILGIYVKIVFESHVPILVKLAFGILIQWICFLDGVNDAWTAVKVAPVVGGTPTNVQ